MAFDETTAIAMRDVARLEQRIAELEAALFRVLDWDRNRDYIVPYRVRDPIIALLNDRPNDGVMGTLPPGYTLTGEDVVQSTEPGSWKCKACGFQGFWRGVHCMPDAADLRNLRQQALTRPAHGGYPDGVPGSFNDQGEGA